MAPLLGSYMSSLFLLLGPPCQGPGPPGQQVSAPRPLERLGPRRGPTRYSQARPPSGRPLLQTAVLPRTLRAILSPCLGRISCFSISQGTFGPLAPKTRRLDADHAVHVVRSNPSIATGRGRESETEGGKTGLEDRALRTMCRAR